DDHDLPAVLRVVECQDALEQVADLVRLVVDGDREADRRPLVTRPWRLRATPQPCEGPEDQRIAEIAVEDQGDGSQDQGVRKDGHVVARGTGARLRSSLASAPAVGSIVSR